MGKWPEKSEGGGYIATCMHDCSSSCSTSTLSSPSAQPPAVPGGLLCPCPFVLLSSVSCTFICPTQLYPAFVLSCAIVLWQIDGHFLKYNYNHNNYVTYETGIELELLTWGRLSGWRSWAQWPRICQVCAFPFPFPVPATWRPVPDFSENTKNDWPKYMANQRQLLSES